MSVNINQPYARSQVFVYVPSSCGVSANSAIAAILSISSSPVDWSRTGNEGGWGDRDGEKGREPSEGKGGQEQAWERSWETEVEAETEREGGSCATGHNRSPSPLTSMCHLTVLQIRLHMLPGDVTTYILTAGLNLH